MVAYQLVVIVTIIVGISWQTVARCEKFLPFVSYFQYLVAWASHSNVRVRGELIAFFHVFMS